MKKFIWLFVIFGLLFMLAKEAFVSAAPSALPVPDARVEEATGQVKFKTASSSDWQIVGNGQILHTGDTVKTGANSSLVLNFYDNSAARLDSNSEVVIKNAAIDKRNTANNKVFLKLNLGRIWARIVNLADREASFEVESNNTVATVRGTTLSMTNNGKGEVEMATVDSLVEYRLLDKKDHVKELSKLLVPAGKTAKLVNGVSVLSTTSADFLNSGWHKKNSDNDQKFELVLREKNADINKSIAGSISPDSNLYEYKLFGERLHVLLAKDELTKQQLKVAFLNRRLAESEQMLVAGKSGLAQSLANQFSTGANEVLAEMRKQNLLRNNLDTMTETELAIKNQLNLQKKLMSDIKPSDPVYSVKEKIDNFELSLADNEDDRAYLLMKQAEEMLHTAKGLEKTDKTDYQKLMQEYNTKMQEIGGKNKLDYQNRLNLIKETVIVPAETKPQAPKADKPQADKATSTISDQLNNIDEIRKAVDQANKLIDEVRPLVGDKLKNIDTKAILEQMKKIPAGTKLPNIPTIPTELPKPIIPPVVKPVVPVVETPKPVSLSIGSVRLGFTAGETHQFQALLKYSDGSIANKTSQASWSVSGDLGSIGGGYLKTATAGGSGEVSARVTVDGQSFSASTENINAMPVIQ